MARRSGSHGPTTQEAIRRAGLTLIYRHGYDGMTLRSLAAEVGLQAGSLYNHFPTKQALLAGLIVEHLDTLLARTDAALARAPSDPPGRLAAFVAHHVTYHIERREEVFVANFELRSLEPENYRAVVALRRQYEARLIAILEAGLAAGCFRLADVRVSAYAVLAMLTGACTWYRPTGRLNRADVIALHTELVLNGCIAPARALADRR
jgi:AcrR family transcriptional regulator